MRYHGWIFHDQALQHNHGEQVEHVVQGKLQKSENPIGFHKHHNTTNQLVSRRVVMEESQLKGEGLYFYFFLTLKEHSTQCHAKINGKEWKN